MDAVHSGCSRIMVYGGGDIVFDTKRSNQRTQYAVYCRIVLYGGGDIVFGAKRSNQRTEWMQYAVHSTQWNSGIWWWGHCLLCKKVKSKDAVDAVCSGIVVYGGGDIVFGAKRSNQLMQYAVDAVK